MEKTETTLQQIGTRGEIGRNAVSSLTLISPSFRHMPGCRSRSKCHRCRGRGHGSKSVPDVTRCFASVVACVFSPAVHRRLALGTGGCHPRLLVIPDVFALGHGVVTATYSTAFCSPVEVGVAMLEVLVVSTVLKADIAMDVSGISKVWTLSFATTL